MRTHNRTFETELMPLVDEINRRQAFGKNVSCSRQIYRELKWRINFTDQPDVIKKRMDDLRESLNSEADQNFADEQDPKDGSWGLCFKEWFLKVWSTHEHNRKNASPRYPVRILDAVNSPEKLQSYLRSVLETDFLNTKVLTRVIADDSISGLGYLIRDEHLKGYAWHPEIKNALKTFLDDWQDPNTGMWGILFNLGWGITVRTEDTGLTFHILGQRRCQANHLDKLAQSMLSLKDINFPFGWKVNGHYENHMNMDAARNFRCAWNQTDEANRKLVAKEMRQELDWSLANSMTKDGAFKLSELDDNLGDAYENGVGFFNQIGYFDKANRFWTQEDFPEATALKEKIRRQILKIGTQDPNLKNALEQLGPGL